MQNEKLKFKIISAFLVLFLVFGLWFLISVLRDKDTSSGALDSFAKCLSDKGFVMYGAYWCPHCQNEKAAFGDSFKFVNYVECTQETQKCLDARIESYPTWICSNGKRLVGEQGPEKLAEASGCSLPQ